MIRLQSSTSRVYRYHSYLTNFKGYEIRSPPNKRGKEFVSIYRPAQGAHATTGMLRSAFLAWVVAVALVDLYYSNVKKT